MSEGTGYSFACSGIRFGEVALRRYSSASLPFHTARAENPRAAMNLRAICWLTGLSDMLATCLARAIGRQLTFHDQNVYLTPCELSLRRFRASNGACGCN